METCHTIGEARFGSTRWQRIFWRRPRLDIIRFGGRFNENAFHCASINSEHFGFREVLFEMHRDECPLSEVMRNLRNPYFLIKIICDNGWRPPYIFSIAVPCAMTMVRNDLLRVSGLLARIGASQVTGGNNSWFQSSDSCVCGIPIIRDVRSAAGKMRLHFSLCDLRLSGRWYEVLENYIKYKKSCMVGIRMRHMQVNANLSFAQPTE